ncbi:DUF4148 domain-containing protein [Burkholderia singularis]|uniref:DUF4148 domain-containing protein n=1 Tax=Burkholderia singularis TaxID=1503053 RepID=A0A238H2X8_9BURK|nr:DUF4148 domain-containing protein [Burkholderia singularis]SMF99594.1 FIG00454409: hypothetical protein [Burkholderia singularis]
MKLEIIAAVVISAFASTSAFADGGHAYPVVALDSSAVAGASVTSPAALQAQSANTVSSGKTREQVRQELIQAYHDGLLPTSKLDYPPSEATIARNKELHRLVEPKWAAQH